HLSTSLAGFRLYNQYFETFAEFKAACEEFFRNPSKYQRELR
ncbi:MAG: Mobile element protein, partial [Olavius algarvensis Gamma 1 endosymbiont]